jgi:hypothetical protein
MTTYTTPNEIVCPRCSCKIAAGTSVRLVPTPRGSKMGCIDCTGERQPTLYAADNNRHLVTAPREGEEANHERRVEAAFLRRQGIYG